MTENVNLLATLGVAALAWYNTTHVALPGHDHHCPDRQRGDIFEEQPDGSRKPPPERLDPATCTCGWAMFRLALIAADEA